MRLAALAIILSATGGVALAQAPAAPPATPPATQAPADAAKGMAGVWELSNSERDQVCNLNFKTEPARAGSKVEFDAACGDSIPALKDVESWTLANETLKLIDSRGRVAFELSEVEVGMYEGERKGEGLYFLQTAASAAVFTPKRSVEQIVGDWVMVRSEKPVCSLTLSNTPTKGFDEFRLSIKPPCDPAMTRLNPNVWRLDRSELILASANGQVWRFEEREPSRWWRVPEGADPIVLQKK